MCFFVNFCKQINDFYSILLRKPYYTCIFLIDLHQWSYLSGLLKMIAILTCLCTVIVHTFIASISTIDGRSCGSESCAGWWITALHDELLRISVFGTATCFQNTKYTGLIHNWLSSNCTFFVQTQYNLDRKNIFQENTNSSKNSRYCNRQN